MKSKRRERRLPHLPSRKEAQEIRIVLDKYRSDNPKPHAPSYDQTVKEIETYYRTAPEGSDAAVRHTQAGFLRYNIEKIVGRRPDVGKVKISRFGDFYMKSGKLCAAPTGQTRLVVPTEAVKAWTKENPNGLFGKRYEFEIEPQTPPFWYRSDQNKS